MKLTIKQLRDMVLEAAKVVDLGAKRAEKTKRWTKVGDYFGNELSPDNMSLEVEVSTSGELALTLGGEAIVLSTVDTAAFLDHVRRALDKI